MFPKLLCLNQTTVMVVLLLGLWLLLGCDNKYKDDIALYYKDLYLYFQTKLPFLFVL